MFNIVWTRIFRFHVAFVIKRLLYIEFRVLERRETKNVGGAKMTQTGNCQFSGLGRYRVFSSMTELFWLCVATRFSMAQQDLA